MKKPVVVNAARVRLKVLGASALVLLLAACGDHPPKDDGKDDTPPPVQASIRILAGSATETGSRDGSGGAARFNRPAGIALDAAGNLFVADQGNFTIRKITPAGVVSTLAGAAGASEIIDAVGGGARFLDPIGLAINGSGTLYVTDYLHIRSVGTGGQVNIVATLPAGTGDGRNTGALIPRAVAVDASGNLFATNGYGTRRIASNATTMLEGVNVVNNSFGTRVAPARGVAVDRNNNVYVADLQNTISRTNGSTTLVHLAGTPNASGSVDGTGNGASFGEVVALTVDPQGNVYAADNTNNLIRKITPGGVATTIAGTRVSTTLLAGPLPGSLAGVRGIATDGKVLYATSGQAVIKITLP
ncbi:hypothetical protein [Massilia yuzhufengensis]|uniref:NHL repeat-containing protein n=1 Tax=Massilia yuzhufengensis TaxID=1164594 RepID=A0A1I1LIT8_9BURK|nr:hypothetical protein [Massilia yuzhufengensis]SFC72929.1 NHL repeat-containing protein [Massilia yuzhufengensis]